MPTKRTNVRLESMGDPHVERELNEELQLFRCIHRLSELDDIQTLAKQLVGATVACDERVYTIKNTMIPDVEMLRSPIMCFASRDIPKPSPQDDGDNKPPDGAA